MSTTTNQSVQYENFEWIDFCNPKKSELEAIARQYHLDYYQIADSLEAGHLPKFEQTEKYHFLILRGLTDKIRKGDTTIHELSNKVAFFYNSDRIITIHRFAFEFLQPSERSFKSTDEVLIHFIQSMAKTYWSHLENLDEQIGKAEKNIFLRDYSKVHMKDLYYLRTQTRITKKLLHIVQSVVHQIVVAPEYKSALQDINDQLLQLTLSYDEVLENANNAMNMFMSVNALKSNEVMKLLTIFSAFFLPLTFIAGIYGMNFKHMPELEWVEGYYLVLAVMLLVAVVIFYWFKRRRIL
jgi:magnesium transporter